MPIKNQLNTDLCNSLFDSAVVYKRSQDHLGDTLLKALKFAIRPCAVQIVKGEQLAEVKHVGGWTITQINNAVRSFD